MVSVNRTYILRKGLEHARDQARLAFMNDMDSTMSLFHFKIDPEFIKHAKFLPVKNFGGRYAIGQSEFTEWVSSIKNELDNLICLERESLPVTHFYDLDPRT